MGKSGNDYFKKTMSSFLKNFRKKTNYFFVVDSEGEANKGQELDLMMCQKGVQIMHLPLVAK